MTIYIYARKSRLSESGESIDIQIQLCRDEIARRYGSDAQIKTYIDEGFSGGSTERPGFLMLVNDLKANKPNILMCYRLDRISRSVSDFSSFIDTLEQSGVAFVSIREHFDTTTPMGRAMMYVSSVFAQLERETIAERITDNMYKLARSGYWLGGRAPLGFESRRVEALSCDGSKRCFYMLSPTPQMDRVLLFYKLFLQYRSLSGVESYCLKNNILNPDGKVPCISSIKTVLRNPIYCTADKHAYYYLISKGVEPEQLSLKDFDGSCGLMGYGKTNQNHSGRQRKKLKDWVIAVGRHKPVLASEVWIEAQELLDKNSERAIKKTKNNTALLAGLLYCRDCGGYMRPKLNSYYADKRRNSVYLCMVKEKSHRETCNVKNAPAEICDQLVLGVIKALAKDTKALFEGIDSGSITLPDNKDSPLQAIRSLDSKIKETRAEIRNLCRLLDTYSDSAAAKHIIDRLAEKDALLAKQQKERTELSVKPEGSSTEAESADSIAEAIGAVTDYIDSADLAEKRRLLRLLLHHATWDGKTLCIYFYAGRKSPFALSP